MLSFSTRYDNVSLMNLVKHVGKKGSLKSIDTLALVGVLKSAEITWDTIISLAQLCLDGVYVYKANEIMHGFDASEYLQLTNEDEQVRIMLKVMIRLGRSGELTKLVETVPPPQHIVDSLIDGIMAYSNEMMLKGKKKEAERTLSSINPSYIKNPLQSSKLGMAYNRLGLYENTLRVFDLADKKGFCCAGIYTHRAIAYLSLNQYDLARKFIEKDIQLYGKSVLNCYWLSRLLNATCHYYEAIEIIDDIAKRCSINKFFRGFLLIEKGNSLRALGKIDESLHCYKEAIHINWENSIGSMISYFEYAITLFSHDRMKEALVIAKKGHDKNKQIFKCDYNPCTILHQFLISHIYNENKLSPAPNEWIGYAENWPRSIQPYDKWMLLLALLILGNYTCDYRKIFLNNLFKKPNFYCFVNRDSVNKLIRSNNIQFNKETIDIIIQKIID